MDAVGHGSYGFLCAGVAKRLANRLYTLARGHHRVITGFMQCYIDTAPMYTQDMDPFQGLE